jgi:hypothetical protein
MFKFARFCDRSSYSGDLMPQVSGLRSRLFDLGNETSLGRGKLSPSLNLSQAHKKDFEHALSFSLLISLPA